MAGRDLRGGIFRDGLGAAKQGPKSGKRPGRPEWGESQGVLPFPCPRKWHPLRHKSVRREAHSAQRKMAAGAAALRRECAPRAHFYTAAIEKGGSQPEIRFKNRGGTAFVSQTPLAERKKS